MPFDLFIVDAFTDRVFGGNPAAVVPLDHWPDDALLQHMAAEHNLSETAFFAPEGDGYRLRWFTPVREVDLCGHATLATAFVLFEQLGYGRPAVRFFTRSGPLTVSRVAPGKFSLDFPTDHLQPTPLPLEAMEALGVQPLETWLGREDYLIRVEDEATVRSLQPDFSRLKAVSHVRGFIVTAPGSDCDFVSRCFYPAYGIDEDPVTGSAHTTLTPFWAERLGKTTLEARQISRRGGKLTCILHGERTELQGSGVLYARGTVFAGA